MSELQNNVKVGIDRIGLYIPYHYLPMEDLAIARDVDPDKYLIGIGQSQMAVPTFNEDIIAMGLNAAKSIITDEDRQSIDQVIFATESGVDYSKSGAVYLHEYLNIQPFASCIEMKQACYGGTRAILTAYNHVLLNPEKKVLVVMSDIARYGLNTGGESTQGAGAVALVIQANPRILALDKETVAYSHNCYDFWRPTDQEYPLVDGKYSQEIYLESWKKVIEQYNKLYQDRLETVKATVFHIPFTKMAYKALNYDLSIDTSLQNSWKSYYQDMSSLSRRVGNVYTGSLYLSLISLLDRSKDISPGDRVGLFSYGSGAVSEYFTGVLCPGYKEMVDRINVQSQLERRKAVNVSEYEEIFSTTGPISDFPEDVYYLESIKNGKRKYILNH